MNILSSLRVLWNYDPVEMQKAMLREVWAEYWLRRMFPISYRMISQRNAGKSPLELFKAGIITYTEVKAAAERGELH